MKAYLMDGYIVCGEEPVEGALFELELSQIEAELINAGANIRYASGAFIITPAKPIIEDAIIVSPVEEVNPRTITKRAFLARITPEEYAAIKTAAAQNAILDYFWQMFMVSEDITLDFPDTIAGINMMEQAGLIAAGRAVEILS